MGNMTDILTNPDRFFGELSGRDVNLKTPLVIVLVSAIIGTTSHVMVIWTTMMMMFSHPVMAVQFVITSFVEHFMTWLKFAALFYIISMLFNGEGSFERCLEFTGYGFILHIIAGVVTIMVVLPTVRFSLENLQPMYSAMPISNIIKTLFMLWSSGIWLFGIKHARNISTKPALITVGINMCLYMLYVL
ncbi:MAG: hypothetical protein C5S47_07375 [Candidatus Methanogasteraceae archaeon]|nr:MAG: hypothetical protein C5S47_07375 [ANME-2 cluster archaeon]